MSESQQGPEICDVISRKRYFFGTQNQHLSAQLMAAVG